MRIFYFSVLLSLCGIGLIPATAHACKRMEDIIPGYDPMMVLGPGSLESKNDLLFQGVVREVKWKPGKGHDVRYEVQKIWRGTTGRFVNVFVTFYPKTQRPANLLMSAPPLIISAARCDDGSFSEPVSFGSPEHYSHLLGPPRVVFQPERNEK